MLAMVPFALRCTSTFQPDNRYEKASRKKVGLILIRIKPTFFIPLRYFFFVSSYAFIRASRTASSAPSFSTSFLARL